jgi:hypothetical protein
MGRSCRICSSADREAIDALIIAGTPDYQIAQQFSMEPMSVGRHRKAHVLRQLQDKLEIVAKGSVVRQERQQLAEAAASDEPSVEALVQAALGTRALLKKLGSIEDRLERMSTRAEEGGSSTGVAALAGQQIRSLEFGARLAGNPNFRPPSAVAQAGEKAVVSIEMVFSNAGRTETISLTETERPVIDGDVVDPSADENVPPPHPNQKFRGRIGDYWDFSKPTPDEDASDETREV